MKYDVENNNLNVVLSGNIDTKTALNLRKGLMDHFDRGVKEVSIDLRQVREIDSTGLGVLISANKLAHKNNGEVFIRGVNGHIKEIFELTRLDKVFKMQGR